MIRLSTPLGAEVLDLHAGDRVLLSGTIYTARDEAHLKIQKDGFPFDPAGAVLYHCGPVVDTKRNVIVAAGPTTSARMNGLTAPMIDAGVRAMSSLRLATTSPVVMSITQTPAFAPRIAFDCAKSSAAFAFIPLASSVCGSSNAASSIAANFEIYLVIFLCPY